VQTYYSTAEFYIPYPTIVTIGMFDGVHVWHRRIIQDLVTRAQELDLESVVLTFWPHPREVLTGLLMQRLTTIEEKITLMEELGVDHLIIQPFTPAFAQMSAQNYMQTILVDQLHVDVVMIWHDHRFGHDRGAGLEELAAFGYEHGFSVTQIPVHEIDEAAVSSTVIREALLW
jgi:riboflavin kinase / FMN adenylyltransferase